MVPSVVSTDLGKYNIPHRPEEAMLFAIVKVCLHSNIFCSYEKTEAIFSAYIYLNLSLTKNKLFCDILACSLYYYQEIERTPQIHLTSSHLAQYIMNKSSNKIQDKH